MKVGENLWVRDFGETGHSVSVSGATVPDSGPFNALKSLMDKDKKEKDSKRKKRVKST